MQIKILGQKLVLTPAIQEYIEMKMKSLEKLMTRYEDKREILVRFELSRETHHHKGKVFYAEANIHLPGKEIRAEGNEASARAAIDNVKDILKIELVRYKEKMISRRKN